MNRPRTLHGLLCIAAFAGGCEEPIVPASSFYEERIDPIVQVGCAQQTNGCHIANLDGEATGNLDMSSYDALMRRDDTLYPYGPYPVGLVLLKGGNDVEVTVETWDPDPTTGEIVARIQTDIRHNAGSIIAEGSAGYAELKRWIESGAQRTGVPDDTLTTNLGSCVRGVGHAPGFDASVDPPDTASWNRFRTEVQPVLRETCAGSQCHGTPVADLYLTCGETDEELRWNYFVALSHVTDPTSTSGLLRRPLSTRRGGTFHEGGNVLESTEDDRYEVLRSWAEDIVSRAPELLRDDSTDRGLRYFANRVQPVLVRKGCMFLNCHSPSMFHDLRLRGGDQGVFSRIATHRNYEMSRAMLGIESPDPNDGRLVAKNLFPAGDVTGAVGILHRGGSLLEDFSGGGAIDPASLDDCEGLPPEQDPDTGDLNQVPAYCVLARWHEIEREEAIASGEIVENATELVWVSRPRGVGEIRDFDTFRGGADLRIASLTFGADESITLGASRSLLDSCGLPGGPDVRTPAVSWDGSRIAFAARGSASEPLRLYEVSPAGGDCAPITAAAAASNEENGILIHDFDPAWGPDGSLVFASTRGNLDGEVDYRGPTRTPAAMQPNANLYVLDGGEVREMTYLLNQELAPSFMLDGRLIFTGEKREPEFHQLALRRQNLDGGDYHPLFAQRDSVGFPVATEVVELTSRNLAFVASDFDARDGAGTIIVANRSIGPDQDDRAADDRAYLHSMRIPHPGAFGRIPDVPAGGGTTGVFRSPAPLPDGRMIVSCDLGATDTSAGDFGWELCVMDPQTGAVTSVGGEAGMANVEAAAVYGRTQTEIFESRIDEANGSTEILPELAPSAEVIYMDFPLLATLLFSNIRTNRPIDPRIGGFRVFEALPPPASATTFGDVSGNVVNDGFGMVFVDYADRGFVPLFGDGSARVRVRGGAPLLLQVTDGDGNALAFEGDGPFTGEIIQREQVQLYPGEQLRQSFPRRFFNGFCGTCHGSITGRELDVAVEPDILTSASMVTAIDSAPVDAR